MSQSAMQIVWNRCQIHEPMCCFCRGQTDSDQVPDGILEQAPSREGLTQYAQNQWEVIMNSVLCQSKPLSAYTGSHTINAQLFTMRM